MSENKDIQQPIVQDSVSSPENAQSSSLMASPSLLSGIAAPLQHSQTLSETDAAHKQSVDLALESSNKMADPANSSADASTNQITNTSVLASNASTTNSTAHAENLAANASTENHPQVLTLGEQFKQEQAELAHNLQNSQAKEALKTVDETHTEDAIQTEDASNTKDVTQDVDASTCADTPQTTSSASSTQAQPQEGHGSVAVSELIDSAAYLTQEQAAAGCHSNDLNNINHGSTLAFTAAQPTSFNLNDHSSFDQESLTSNTASSTLQPNTASQNSSLAPTESQSSAKSNILDATATTTLASNLDSESAATSVSGSYSVSESAPLSNIDSISISEPTTKSSALETTLDDKNNEINAADAPLAANESNDTAESNENNKLDANEEHASGKKEGEELKLSGNEAPIGQTSAPTDSIANSEQASQSNDTLSLMDGSGTTTNSQDQDAVNIVLHGNAASRGIAFGRIAFLQRNAPASTRSTVEDAEAEVERFEQARIQAISQLSALYEATVEKLGEQNAVVFQIHQMMLDDPDYVDAIRDTIREEKVNAEYAVQTTGERFADMFRKMEDNEYMQGRASDVIDVSHRLTGLLSSHEHGLSTKTVYHYSDNAEPIILATDDLAPSETVQLDQNLVHAILTTEGSSRSHTVIFARTLGLPAVINIGSRLSPELEGKMAIVDGGSGIVIINPDEKTHQQYVERKRTEDALRARLEQFRGKETLTLTGRKINLYANIGAVSDIDLVKTSDAEGIGLFRSEYIYLSSNDFPSEETQFNIYKETLAGMDGKKVVIRTLDIGADKTADYFMLKHEENPAMGMRAVRICLTKPEIFKTQLRALYRASVYGTLAIMFPMITSVEEIQECKRICKEVQNELAAEGKPFSKNVELGIMIETPASAIISDLLAEHVDFFSIGTNDLIQFTLAVDRQNAEVGRFLNPYHRAVIRLIEMTVNNAHKNGIWVGVCGELAADEGFTHELVRIGVDELSVVPSSILMLRARISTLG